MLPNKEIDRIELLLNKDKNTQNKYTLKQFDYNIYTAYDLNNESERRIDVNISGCNTDEPDNIFLQWIANYPSDWSGIIKIFYKNEENPNLTLNFKKSILNSYSQSFTDDSGYQQSGYFAAQLIGVVINEVKMS
ncbi:hypothetical protein [Zunongwangia sp.]|uniref:hypothetical protein n=1 Tax=Zunongwangia sp. TaxID=1965325 RepID=UPI003AA8129D